MSILAVPAAGLHLESSASSNDSLPMQAFGISLDNSMIEGMIRCVQNGQKIELSLGADPSLKYDNHEHHLKDTALDYDYDLYFTKYPSSNGKASRLPNPTMGIFHDPKLMKGYERAKEKRMKEREKQQGARVSSSAESEAEPLSNSIARSKTRKDGNSTKIMSGVSAESKRGKGSKSKQLLPTGMSAMAAALSGSASAPRSLPPSPALHGAASPSINPAYTATQQLHEKNKGERSTLVHELAVRDRTFEYLASRWTGPDVDLKAALAKVADEVDNKWSMKKLYWKELDVWNYDYDNQEERQAAIDNAIKQYDRQRVGTTSPEWERLLRKDERGKGKILSRLQVNLAKGNITPLPKISKADEGSKGESDESSKNKGGEAMARSSSQNSSKTKPKAVVERDTQAKKLLPSNTKKPAPIPKKTAAAKSKAVEKPGKKVLSEEFVHDSSSEDEAPLAKSTSAAKSASTVKTSDKPIEKAAERPKQSPAPPPKSKTKPIIRAPKAVPPKAVASAGPTAQKRSREDDDSSSSSGTPLAKRLKSKDVAAKPTNHVNGTKHRPSDASQNSRATTSSSKPTLNRSKNTSPTKSSPLASSPPTNASDLDESTQGRSQPQHPARATNGLSNGTSASKKRQISDSDDHLTPKKRAKLSDDILTRAQRFEMYYKKYESLHHQLSGLASPPADDLTDLYDMRQRLVDMKAEIKKLAASEPA